MYNAGDTTQSPPPDSTALKQEQAKLRGAITRAYNRCIAGDPFEYDKVNQAYKRLNDIEETIFADGIPSSEESKMADYTQKMIAIRKAKGILKDERKEKPKINFKLENIPKFDGDFQNWRVFKAIFDEMVTNNPDCDPSSNKRHLLRV